MSPVAPVTCFTSFRQTHCSRPPRLGVNPLSSAPSLGSLPRLGIRKAQREVGFCLFIQSSPRRKSSSMLRHGKLVSRTKVYGSCCHCRFCRWRMNGGPWFVYEYLAYGRSMLKDGATIRSTFGSFGQCKTSLRFSNWFLLLFLSIPQ